MFSWIRIYDQETSATSIIKEWRKQKWFTLDLNIKIPVKHLINPKKI